MGDGENNKKVSRLRFLFWRCAFAVYLTFTVIFKLTVHKNGNIIIEEFAKLIDKGPKLAAICAEIEHARSTIVYIENFVNCTKDEERAKTAPLYAAADTYNKARIAYLKSDIYPIMNRYISLVKQIYTGKSAA